MMIELAATLAIAWEGPSPYPMDRSPPVSSIRPHP
jgi:hypothetical protein